MARAVKDPLFEKGVRIRKEILGAEYVDRRAQASDEYTWPFEEFSAKAAWGLIWSRPGLSRKARSLVNLGMLTALGQPQELRLHIRVALRNGLTRKEIAEALLHTAVYCGIPRAADARRAMVEVFAQIDAEKNDSRKGRRTKA